MEKEFEDWYKQNERRFHCAHMNEKEIAFAAFTEGHASGYDLNVKEKPFWLSIRKAQNCLFSRRNGYFGKVIFGYSICLRLFGKDLI